MNNEVSETLLSHLVSVSEAMVAAATDSRWDDLAELDQQRHQLLDQLSDNGHAFDPGRFMLASQTVSQLDQKILQIVRDARETTAAEHKKLQTNRDAVSSYTMAQSPAT